MKDPAPPIAHAGTLATAPWAAIVGHMARKSATGRVELEVGSVMYAAFFENGAPIALLSGELDADTPEPIATLADKLTDLAKSPGTSRYVIHDGDKPDPKTPTKACDPFAIVMSALAKAPPAKIVSAAIATIGTRALAKAKALPKSASSIAASLDGGPRTLAALVGGATADEKAKRELEIYGLLVVGAIEAGDAASAPKVPAAKPAPPKPAPPKPAPPKPPPPPVIAAPEPEEIDVVISAPPAKVAEILNAPQAEVAITVGEIKVDGDGLDAQAHYEKAYKILSSGSIDETDAALAKALALDPEHPDAVTLGIWLEVRRAKDPTEGVLEDFITELDAVIERAPRCERAYFYRGSLYKRLGKTGRATDDFEKATELNPRSVSLARGLQLAKDDAPVPIPKAMPTPAIAFAPEPPRDPEVTRKRRIAIMTAMVVVLGAVAAYLYRPAPPPADTPDFSWVPGAGPSATPSP